MSLSRRVVLLAGVLTVGLVPAAHAGPRVVKAKDFLFKPGKVTIKRGSIVKWRFLDASAHNVVSRGTRRFRSSQDMRSGTYRVRFRKRGRYRYVCTIHPLSMRGVVTV